jgi:hypothetical protein
MNNIRSAHSHEIAGEKQKSTNHKKKDLRFHPRKPPELEIPICESCEFFTVLVLISFRRTSVSRQFAFFHPGNAHEANNTLAIFENQASSYSIRDCGHKPAVRLGNVTVDWRVGVHYSSFPGPHQIASGAH